MDFRMVGKLSMSKETENFIPYEIKKYDSGWVNRTLRFNVICGDNTHFMTVKGGSYEDGHGDVYTFSKGGTDNEGKKIKGESLKIPFKDRFTSPKLEEVAEFKKFVFDTEKPKRRLKLQKALERIKDGTSITDEELKDLGVSNEEEIKAEYEKSLKRKHEFITEWDFAEFIFKVINSGKFANKKFYMKGSSKYSYYDVKDTVYESFVPQKIYLADDDAEEYSVGTMKLLYGTGSFDDLNVDEKQKYYVNGWVFEHDDGYHGDDKTRKNIPVETTIAIPLAPEGASDKDKKKIEIIKRKFVVDENDETIYELGIEVNMLNGSQKMEITEDMLTEEQKDDLDCELITMDDIRAELGGNVYGDRIKEYQFSKLARGYSKGRIETDFTIEDMSIKKEESTDLFEDEPDDEELL